MGNLIEYRCGLIDFQVGRDHGKLEFNPAEYIKSCAASNMKRVMFTCKDAYGDAYYKSDLIELNPMAGTDYLQAAIDEAKRQNMELYAYYNVLLDDIYADSNPEHRMIDQKGDMAISYDYYKALCPNSPYVDVLRKRVADLVFNYEIDGIFFDISYFGGGKCFCEYCKEKFRQEFGYELKRSITAGTDEYADFNQFRRLSRSTFLINLAETIREIKSIPVIWNGSGSFYLAEPEVDEYSDYLTTEFHAPDYLDGIIRAKWMQTRKKGFIMSTPSELGSWGDWTMVPHATLKSVVCSIAAHGGGVFFNHTPYPSGDFAKSRIKCLEDNIGESFRYLEKYENLLRDTVSASDTAVLLSIESRRFCENGIAGYSSVDFTSSLKGAVKMMLESGISFDVIDEFNFPGLIDIYRTLIIPLAPCLGRKTAQLLGEFIQSGGNVICCSDINFYDEYGDENINNPLPNLMGFKAEGFSELTVEYMTDFSDSIKKDVPDMPILVKSAGRLLNIKPKGAAILASKAVPPFEAIIEKHVYHQHAHPFKRTEYASAVKGRGGIYFSADIFRSFYNTASPWLKKIYRNVLEIINPKPVISVEAPACVYPTLLVKDNDYLLQLININGAIPEVAKSYTEEILSIPEIYVETGLDINKIYDVLTGEEIPFSDDGEFVLTDTGVHTAVVIETGE